MLASEFIEVIQEAGFSWEKVTAEDLKHQPNGAILTSPGIRVEVGNAIHLWPLKNIGNMSRDELNQIINLESDFATIPEKG